MSASAPIPRSIPDVAKGQDSSIYWNPEASAERAAHYVKLGFTGIKFDPAAPYSPFDPRQPSLESMDLCEKFCKLDPRSRRLQGRSAVRHPWPVHHRGRHPLCQAASRNTSRSGSKNRPRRKSPRRWRWSPAPPRIPIATGERLVTKYEFARVLETRAASILQMEVGRVGGLLEAKKIASMAEAYYAQIAPHLYARPGDRHGQRASRRVSPNFLILESIETWGGFHAQDHQEAGAVGSRLRHPADRAGPRHRAR